jgi:signal transduction histidine kinase
MFRHSLRNRVVFTFGLFSALLGIIGGFGAYAAARITENRVIERHVRLAVADYVHRFARDADAAPPDAPYLTSYRDASDLPAALRSWAARMPEDGYYRLWGDLDVDLDVAVVSVGAPLKPLYVVADVEALEMSETEEAWWIASLAPIVLTSTLLAIVLGAAISRRMIDPVVRLADLVGGMDSEQLSDSDWRRIQAARFGDDEVGLLARTIEKTLQRICAFIDRERYFTSAASHELRTPVTVIKGALELLDQPEHSKNASRAVARIKRATIDMQSTIDMFLCLSRETDNGRRAEHFAVGALVEQAIEHQRHLLVDKNIAVDVTRSAEPCLLGHPQAFAIAVNNLVRNAFEHTPANQGPIRVHIDHHEVAIRNHGAPDVDGAGEFREPRLRGSATQGFGLGLGIVQRLCEQNGWRFVLHVTGGAIDARLSWSANGATVRPVFDPPDPRASHGGHRIADRRA